MTRSALTAVALSAALAASSGAQPTGFHRRVENGWTLVTISIPAPDVTICLLDPPETPRIVLEGALPVRARSLAGHVVLRVDAPSLEVALGNLSPVLDGGEAALWSPEGALSDPERHLLALCGADVDIPVGSPPGRPLLLAAGNHPASALMEALLPLARGLPSVRAIRPSDVRAPLGGWWRHVDVPGPGAVWIGWITSGELKPSDRAALRVLFRAAAVRFGERGWPSRFQSRATAGGVVRWLRAPVTPELVPGAVDTARAVLESLRQAALSVAEFDAHRDVLRNEDIALLRRPDRWFPNVLGAEVRGELPTTAFDSKREWAQLTPESLRERALVLLPNDVVVVSAGTRPADPETSPSEVWPEPSVMSFRELPTGARRSVVESVMARLREHIPDSLEAFVVESDWTWLRDRASLTGRLVERFAPDRLSESFFPLDGGIGFDAWVSETGAGAGVLDQTRALPIEDRIRMQGRFWSDPWRLLRRIGTAAGEGITYGGGIQEDEQVFQLVTIEEPGLTISLRVDPRAGLPRRVTVRRSDSEREVEYRYFDYEARLGGRYPKRIERFEGIRRTSVRQVRDVRRGARLATADGLR